jgi:hypothetical protein
MLSEQSDAYSTCTSLSLSQSHWQSRERRMWRERRHGEPQDVAVEGEKDVEGEAAWGGAWGEPLEERASRAC